MKKLLYILAFGITGLLWGQQGFAQRHARSTSHSHREQRKVARKVQKQRVKSYRHATKHVAYARPGSRNHVALQGRSHYAARPQYYGRRIVRSPRYHVNPRMVPWAAARHYRYAHHVYFPDYNTFYDAGRGGYVYRHGGRWIFSAVIPSFLVGINWNNARIEYMNGVPLDVYPQTYYNTYHERYPAVSLNVNIGL